MTTRISTTQASQLFLSDLNSTVSKMNTLQRQITTGHRINQISDDPYGSSQILNFSSQLSDLDGYVSNVNDAIGFTDTADSSLQTVSSLLAKVRERLTYAANGTLNASDRQAIAAEMTQLKSALQDSANAKYGDNYIFSGTATTTQPYPNAVGNPYNGNTGAINRRISVGVSMQVNIDGSTVFGAPGTSVFDTMDQIITDLNANNVTALGNDLGTIQGQHNTVLAQLANIGAMGSRLESVSNQLADQKLRLQDAQSKVQDVDSAEAFTKYSIQQTMYQSALAVGSRMMSTSLVDYLR